MSSNTQLFHNLQTFVKSIFFLPEYSNLPAVDFCAFEFYMALSELYESGRGHACIELMSLDKSSLFNTIKIKHLTDILLKTEEGYLDEIYKTEDIVNIIVGNSWFAYHVGSYYHPSMKKLIRISGIKEKLVEAFMMDVV